MSTPEAAGAFFDAKDVDGSGSLSRKELSDALKNNGYSARQIKGLFAETDLDDDGQVSKEEFLIYMGHCDPAIHAEARKKQFFRQFDKDCDGKVDKDELRASMAECEIEWSEEETARAMEILDTDDSGSITCNELIVLLYGDQDADD